jgi:hypothetical protein
MLEASAILAAAGDPGRAAATGEREVQELLAAATRIYAGRRASEGGFPAFAAGAGVEPPTATEVVLCVSAMLESAGIELFELGLWQTWGGGA